MKTPTRDRILLFTAKTSQTTAHDIALTLHLSRQAVHRQLKKMVTNGELKKIGTPPKVFYMLPDDPADSTEDTVQLHQDEQRILNKSYLYVSPTGHMVGGVDGFVRWCKKTNQPIEKTAREYIQTLQKYDTHKHGGLIDGMEKIRTSFTDVGLDHMYYLDFYSIERFGKTKLGQLLLYAKQSQNRELTKQLAAESHTVLEQLIDQYSVQAIGFIPPTVKRQIQFIHEFERYLNLQLPTLSLTKVIGDVAIPQKTMNKLEDRIENAKKTIFVTEDHQYDTVLLIDDAVGSGATLNETAKKLKEKGIAHTVIGLAITGSFKGFDVISEV